MEFQSQKNLLTWPHSTASDQTDWHGSTGQMASPWRGTSPYSANSLTCTSMLRPHHRCGSRTGCIASLGKWLSDDSWRFTRDILSLSGCLLSSSISVLLWFVKIWLVPCHWRTGPLVIPTYAFIFYRASAYWREILI